MATRISGCATRQPRELLQNIVYARNWKEGMGMVDFCVAVNNDGPHGETENNAKGKHIASGKARTEFRTCQVFSRPLSNG